MSEIGSGSGSSFPSALDTNAVREVNAPSAGKTKARAEVPNDLGDCVVSIQTELGTDPAGTKANVKTYLQTEHNLDGTHNLTALAMVPTVVALTDQATITTDCSLGGTFTVTLGGNRTLAAPTNPTDGQRCIWRFEQDATGTRTLALNAIFRLGTDISDTTLTTTASKLDYLGAVYNGTDVKWDVIAFVKGY